VWKQQARINYTAAQMAINIEHAISMKCAGVEDQK